MKQHFLYTEGGGIAPANLDFDPEFLIIDLFCGAGGTTSGFERAMINGKRVAKVIACVNHDPIAIKSHWKNHPEVIHFEEDIRSLDLGPLKALVEAYRVLYPKAIIILWASLECTNFSKAKGGQPRDADSRTLADHLERYILSLNPDYVQIENVVEFMSWGPLDDNGKPVSKKSGSDWMRWRRELCNLGYYDDWRELNSADFGAYTSRNRLFGCFAKDGLPIVWPEPTHSKKQSAVDLFRKPLAKWMPVKDVLDFDDEGQSIFTRKKRLSDKTLQRIYAGLIKYVAGGKNEFLVKWNSMQGNGYYQAPSTDDPCPVITTQNRLGLCFIAKSFSGRPEGKVIPITGPAGTITCFGSQSLVQPIPFLVASNGGQPSAKVFSTENPCRTITTSDNKAIVMPFIAKYYGSGGQLSSIEEPSGTLTTVDRFAKVQPVWIDREFSGGGQHSSIENPCGSLLPVPKTNIVKATPFIMKTGFNNFGSSIEKPSPVIDASRHHHYLINPSHSGHTTSVDNPCPVIIARQDKSPLYLANVYQACGDSCSLNGFLDNLDLQLLSDIENDVFGPMIKISVRLQILEFMAIYAIADIKMRMLKVSELKVIQGFGKDYILEGNQTDQKKFIGNSVHPFIPEYWIISKANRLRQKSNVA
ncbi:MAG: DNA cytosine methyltransferase [Pedobacter sp.]|nr:DNA cytosine methyltransferase [Cellulomonas sp.]